MPVVHFNDPTRDVFVVGIDDDQDLFLLASRFGTVLYARVVKNRVTQASKGFGFCRYSSSEEAIKGQEGLYGLRLRSRTLRAKAVQPGKIHLSPYARTTQG